MCPSLIRIGSKKAEKNSAQTNKQTHRQTDRHYENNGHLAVNQKQRGGCVGCNTRRWRGWVPTQRGWRTVIDDDVQLTPVQLAARSFFDKWSDCSCVPGNFAQSSWSWQVSDSVQSGLLIPLNCRICAVIIHVNKINYDLSAERKYVYY